MRVQLIILVTSLLCISPNVVALAQLPPGIPAGSIESPRRPVTPLPNTPTETLPPPLNIPASPPLVPPTNLGIKVKVKRIEFLGNTAVSQAELDAATAPFIGKVLTFEELLQIRTVITNLYTSKGYSTSGAFLPPQDITDGVITVQIVEGVLERIEIKGLTRLRESYVRDRLALGTSIPIDLRRLETALQLLQLDPIFSSVNAELTAGSAPGLSVLKVTLKQAPPINAMVEIDNRNSPSVGSIGGTVSLSHNNITGRGDRLNLDLGMTTGIRSFNLGYQVPVNPHNGTVSLSYGNSSSRIIEKPFSPLDINSRAWTFSAGFRQPLSRTPTSEFALGGSFDLRQSETFVLEDIPFSYSLGPENGRSRIAAFRFSQDWINRSPTQVWSARSQFSIGLPILAATVNNTGVDGRFTSWVGQLQYVQALSQETILIARIATQLTSNSLLPIEQFSIGGVDTVRGYRQNQNVADNGVIGSVEVRFPIYREPQGTGIILFAPFFDIGTVWNNRSSNPNPNPATLASVGVGLRLQADPTFSIRLDYGIPLTSVSNPGNSLQDSGFFFSIRYQPF